MSYNLTPLNVCCAMIAEMKDLGGIARQEAKAGYGWQRGSKYRAAGDLPSYAQRHMLAYAQKNRIPLKPEWLIVGAKPVEIQAAREKMLATGKTPPPFTLPVNAASEVAAE